MQVWRAAARELVKDNVAIVRSDDDRRVTYRELKEAAVAYAADWAGALASMWAEASRREAEARPSA